MAVSYKDDAKPALADVLALYRSVGWSSADKPDALYKGLLNSHALITAWDDAGATEPLWIFDGHEHD
jgi:hypothetical protein